MSGDQQAVNAEILERLTRIEAGVKATNGRVSSLETWRNAHETQASARDLLLEDHRKAIDMVQERFTEVALACQTTPANLEHAVAKVLDKRQTTEDAAKYRALVKRFGEDPAEDLGAWHGLQAGARAIGWKVVGTIVVVLAIALLAVLFSIWATALKGAT